MKLPETQNANHQYAFKKGYRLAQEGKTLSAMPSAIRYDAQMREYFQQGWAQFQEDIALAEETQESPWRQRAAWYLMMILAGIGTASLMVDEIQQSKREKQPDTLQQITQTPANIIKEDDQAQKTLHTIENSNEFSLSATPQLTAKTHTITNELETLSLLNSAARQDLLLNQAEQEIVKNLDAIKEAPPVSGSNIQIGVAQLTHQISDRQAIDDLNGQTIPKSTRKLYYFTRIDGAKGQTIYHRWIYNKQVMATIALEIKTDSYRTWSSKRLSSAWQGEWTLEVLDNQHTPIYRQKFRYVQ